MSEYDLPVLEPAEASATSLPLLSEDLAHLRSILNTLGLGAGYRREGVTRIQVIHAPADTHHCSCSSRVGHLEPEVPLYLPCGRRSGCLGILPRRETESEDLKLVIDALLSLTAESISERWFRLQHRKAWILAATPSTHPGDALLLALDQQQALQAMDFRAAQFLRSRGTEAKSARLADFFSPISPLPTRAIRADVPMRLREARSGEAWIGVLTPPDCDPHMTWTAETLAHTRPRGHGLTDLTAIEQSRPGGLPTLTSGMLRKIAGFIDTHIETPLPVERLAREAGLSPSHFSRAFRNALKMTPHRYVMWRRLQRAQDLITSSDVSLTEAALAVGFADQSHFSRLFRQNIGESPSRFRQLHRWGPPVGIDRSQSDRPSC